MKDTSNCFLKKSHTQIQVTFSIKGPSIKSCQFLFKLVFILIYIWGEDKHNQTERKIKEKYRKQIPSRCRLL